MAEPSFQQIDEQARVKQDEDRLAQYIRNRQRAEALTRQIAANQEQLSQLRARGVSPQYIDAYQQTDMNLQAQMYSIQDEQARLLALAPWMEWNEQANPNGLKTLREQLNRQVAEQKLTPTQAEAQWKQIQDKAVRPTYTAPPPAPPAAPPAPPQAGTTGGIADIDPRVGVIPAYDPDRYAKDPSYKSAVDNYSLMALTGVKPRDPVQDALDAEARSKADTRYWIENADKRVEADKNEQYRRDSLAASNANSAASRAIQWAQLEADKEQFRQSQAQQKLIEEARLRQQQMEAAQSIGTGIGNQMVNQWEAGLPFVMPSGMSTPPGFEMGGPVNSLYASFGGNYTPPPMAAVQPMGYDQLSSMVAQAVNQFGPRG